MERAHLFSERNMHIPSFGLCPFFAVILFLAGRIDKRGAIWGTALSVTGKLEEAARHFKKAKDIEGS